MFKGTLFIFLVLSFSLSGISQEKKKLKDLSFFEIVDSLFIDHDLKNYSARVFSNYKVKQFRLINDDYKMRYVPNNRFGLGFGIANKKELIDIAFNIKSGKKEATKRFDAQGTIILLDHHYFNGYLQLYNGFNIRNNFGEPSEFRTDIKSKTIGFNYLYTFSEIEFSYSLLKAGLAKHNKNVYVTGGVGTFAIFDYFSADGTVLPENGLLYFNEQANIERYNGRALGLLGGVLTAFVLPEDFIVTCNLMPGIALINEKVTLQDLSKYRPSNPILYKLDISFAVSYNTKRYYINLLYGTGIYSTNIDFDNRYRYNLTMAKLAFGYKLKI